MDSKFYVSLEAARLLKEKGYDEECISYYHDNCREVDYSFCGERNSTWEGRCVSAPSKDEAIDWLESKGVVVVLCRVTPIYMGYAGEKEWSFDLELKESGKYDGCLRFQTRLEAEDAAIIKACEFLENGN
jgi:hypothetical protein